MIEPCRNLSKQQDAFLPVRAICKSTKASSANIPLARSTGNDQPTFIRFGSVNTIEDLSSVSAAAAAAAAAAADASTVAVLELSSRTCGVVNGPSKSQAVA
jgi:hypothetical protein